MNVEVKLCEIADVTKLAGFEFTKYISYEETGEIIALRALNLRNGVLDLTDVKRINRTVSDMLPRSKLFQNDILLTYTGNGYGDCAIITENDKYHLAPNICKITPKTEKVIPYYLYSYIRSASFYKQMTNHMVGSSQPTIPMKILRELKIPLPSISIQRKIAAILSALDEKIAINRAINENLQQQARALYKSWFVDFEPFDKRMPDLWKIGKLKDVLCLRKEVLKAGERTDLCYLPIDTIPMNTFALTSTRPNEEAQSSLLAFYRDDIIIGAMRVYFHRVIIAPFDGITRSTCFVLTPKDPNYLAFGLLCCDQDKSIDFAQQSSKGSTMPYAVWDGGLGELEIAIPPQDIASEFNTIIMPMIREIQKSYYETGILSNIRDTLSPKLMSGEIDVSAILF